MVGKRLIQVISGILAHREVIPDLLQQFAFGGDALKEHDQLEAEEDFGIDGGPSAEGIAGCRERADKGEVEQAVEMPIEMVPGHHGIKGDENGSVEIAAFGWTEHGAPPSGYVEGGML